MTEYLIEGKGPHDDDYHEHLGMDKEHHVWGTTKSHRSGLKMVRTQTGGFQHLYGRKRNVEHGEHTFHGVMEYHGYKEKKNSNKNEIHYHRHDKEDVHHHIVAKKDGKGGIGTINHTVYDKRHENYKHASVHDLKESTGAKELKKLREAFPTKTTTTPDIELPSSSEAEIAKKFLRYQKIVQIKPLGDNVPFAKPDMKKAVKGPKVGKYQDIAPLKEPK